MLYFFLIKYLDIVHLLKSLLWFPVEHKLTRVLLEVFHLIVHLCHWIYFYRLFFWVELELESKGGANTNLRPDFNITLKLLSDLLRYDKSKANSILVDALRLLKEAKHLEQFVKILLRNTHTCVFYWNLKETVQDLNMNVHFTPLGELQSIGLETQ